MNVVLDVILNRSPWVADARQIWDYHHSGRIVGCLTATEFTNLFYIVRRFAGDSAARTAVRTCLATFEILAVDESTLEAAEQLQGVDFEDNVCVACAM